MQSKQPEQPLVSIVRCADYDRARVKQALHAAIAPLGGIEAFVSPGSRVLIKPNLIAGTPPERGATTHPEILRAVIEEVRSAGGEATVGESPGAESFRTAARKSGLLEVMEELSVEEASFSNTREVHLGSGHIAPSLPIAEPILDADVIISLPKLKAHGLVAYTGCIKNMFGVISGVSKAKYHLRFQDRDTFSALLAQIYAVATPTLSILDGIVAMEGNGPRNGDPVSLGLLLASTNGLAADIAACSIIGLNPMDSPPLSAAADLGLGPRSLADVAVSGPPIDELKVVGFKTPRASRPSLRKTLTTGWAGITLRNMLTTRPALLPRECRGCGVCARACPAQAITMANGAAHFDYSKCIRCYCCQELCERGAIVLKTPPLAGLFR
ncbi:MAG: DUF362 domain-containing protein [Clostridia bacterium]|nr:DUF362 domain-containing protein [Clostridia bacterium]